MMKIIYLSKFQNIISNWRHSQKHTRADAQWHKHIRVIKKCKRRDEIMRLRIAFRSSTEPILRRNNGQTRHNDFWHKHKTQGSAWRKGSSQKRPEVTALFVLPADKRQGSAAVPCYPSFDIHAAAHPKHSVLVLLLLLCLVSLIESNNHPTRIERKRHLPFILQLFPFPFWFYTNINHGWRRRRWSLEWPCRCHYRQAFEVRVFELSFERLVLILRSM